MPTRGIVADRVFASAKLSSRPINKSLPVSYGMKRLTANEMIAPTQSSGVGVYPSSFSENFFVMEDCPPPSSLWGSFPPSMSMWRSLGDNRGREEV
jgi:hypothetical protein